METIKCRPGKDFLRHIANRVSAEYSKRLPAAVIEDFRNMLGKAEDRYRFTIYGGRPENLVKFFRSEEWRDLVEYAGNTGSLQMLKDILRSLAEAYRHECPEVAREAEAQLSRLEESIEGFRKETLDADKIFRMLKISGYRVEKSEDGSIKVDEGLIKVIIRVEGETLEYTICKDGKAKSLDGVFSKLSKIREL